MGANARVLDAAVSCASPFVVPSRKDVGAETEIYINIHADNNNEVVSNKMVLKDKHLS